jgi:hypothetical protein
MEMSNESVFSGDQAFETKEELLTLMCHLDRQQISGALVVNSQRMERALFLENGRIIFAHSNRFEDSLGYYLLSRKSIDQQQLEEASKRVRETDKRLGRVLLEMGILDYHSLWESVGSHLKEIVYACFQHESGTYSLLPGNRLSDENILMNLHISELVWEVMRRGKVPRDPDYFLKNIKKVFIVDRARLDLLNLMPYERHVIDLLEKYHQLDMIVKQSELLPVDTKRMLAVLGMMGIISETRDARTGASDPGESTVTVPFSSFDEALRHYNTLLEMICKMLKKEIGPIAMTIYQNTLDEIRDTLPGPFKKAELTSDGRISEQLLQKTIWSGDMKKRLGDFVAALDEILYAQIYAVRKNLGNEHEQQVLRWVRGDRN